MWEALDGDLRCLPQKAADDGNPTFFSACKATLLC